MLTEKLDAMVARLEHTSTPRKSLKRLTQETRVSKFSIGMATQLLKSSSESAVKCKKDCSTCASQRNKLSAKYLPVDRTAFSTTSVICEL
jgi:hypothetical protein